MPQILLPSLTTSGTATEAMDAVLEYLCSFSDKPLWFDFLLLWLLECWPAECRYVFLTEAWLRIFFLDNFLAKEPSSVLNMVNN